MAEFLQLTTAYDSIMRIKPRKILIFLAVVLILLIAKTYVQVPIQDELTSTLDCAALFRNDNIAIKKFKDWKPPWSFSEDQLLKLTSDCDGLKKEFRFPSRPLSTEEAEFPIAYVTIVYNHPEQLIRMLSSLNWPQNLYCITYDTKASNRFKQIVHNLGKCFKNVILPNNHAKIEWARFGVLEAAVNCLRALHQTDHKWHYVQVISGHTLPLRTNREMVRIFKIFDGANDCEMTQPNVYRYQMKKLTLPGNITIIKGNFAATLHRAFVAFLFNNSIAQEYFQWLNGTRFPDEHYWATLIHNDHLNAPGNFPQRCLPIYENKTIEKWITRFHLWVTSEDRCQGKFAHTSCIYGVGDLPLIAQQPHLSAHKVYYDYQPATFHCLRQLVQNRTYGIGGKQRELNYYFYKQLPAVKYHKMENKTAFDCPLGMEEF